MYRFSQRPVPEDKGTCGFVRGVLIGARRDILAQKKNDLEIKRSLDHAEVGGGLCQLVSELDFLSVYCR
jgi:hypothetical protein